jgi:glycogen synthase
MLEGTFLDRPTFRLPVVPQSPEKAIGIPVKVLMFGWEFPPYQAGGLATATIGLVRGLLRIGVDVTLVVPFPVEQSPIPRLKLIGTDPGRDRLVVHRIPSPLDPYGGEAGYQEIFASARRHAEPHRAVYGRDLQAEVDRFADLAADIAASEPHDVIDAHDWIAFEAGLRAQRRSGRPLVAHIHAIELDRSGGPGDPRIADREQRGMAAASRVVSNSGRLRSLCVQRYGIRPEKIDVVHWGIDDESGPPSPAPRPSPFPAGTPVVLFLGRVTGQKGPDIFLEMAHRVSRFVPAARFVIAGSGDLLPGMIERAAELGIAARVHFTGGLTGDLVRHAFRLADVCVMPSRSEPFGLVALESLLNGVPCVLPRDSGVAEVVRNAFKVDCRDVDDLTNKVVALLKHRALRDELRDRGRDEVALPRFGLEEPARLTAAAYERALLPSH